MRNPIAVVAPLLALSVGAYAYRVGAYESTCVQAGYQSLYPQTAAGMMSRTCAGITDVTSTCNTSFDQARGALMSEHAWLAHEGMRWAGLASFYDNPAAGPIQYYASTLGAKSVNKGALDSVEPAIAGRMTVSITGHRVRNTIPEFAEVPDFSYSLSDYILGNEHCFAENASANDPKTGKATWRDGEKGVDACHSFDSHRGSVNSTHFSPQNRSAYRLYHRLALTTADQCKRLSGALGRTSMYVAACEKEALTFEAVGAHYLGDAWSAGHMWQRWGSPSYGTTPLTRYRSEMVAMMSGIIHGWRDVARGYSETASIQDDQLCMPGFFVSDLSAADKLTFAASGSTADLESRNSDSMVQWRYPPTGAVLSPMFFAGGDEYLFLCRNTNPKVIKSSGAFLNQERWYVSASDDTESDAKWPLATQYRRMLTCLAHGMGEVYERGPKTVGEVVRGGNFDPLIDATSVDEQDACWDMRATNQSMELGARISNGLDGEVSFAEPSFVTRVVSEVLPILGDVEEGTELTVFQTLQEEPKFRAAMATMGMALSKLATQDPYGIHAAQLDDTNLLTFYGLNRNSEYVSLIENDGVSYFERHDKTSWGHTLKQPASCKVDSDCGAAEYCSFTNATVAGLAPGTAKQCVRHEMAILRAFRDAEIAYYCDADTLADLSAAKKSCGSVASLSADACQSCVQVVTPHIRPKGHPSICDQLRSSGVIGKASATTASVSSNAAMDPPGAAAAFCQAP